MCRLIRLEASFGGPMRLNPHAPYSRRRRARYTKTARRELVDMELRAPNPFRAEKSGFLVNLPGPAVLRGEQFLNADRQIANTDTGGMKDGARNRRCRADVPQFTQAFDTGRIHVVVDLRHENDLDVLDVRIHRHQIVG